VMVYGEYVQSPAVKLCKLLAEHLPPSLEVTYLTNSGTEAIEGAMKLAKRVTGKTGFVAAKQAYHTAAVVLETIQGGAGFIVPQNDYLKAVKARCEAVGALLILDEIQPGIGRTGKLFSFEHYGITPDILVIGKGLGGGMPIGAFCSSTASMATLTQNPSLGHITTFGGNPVIAAAALATLETILRKNLMAAVPEKEALFRKLLVHPKIRKINGKGLMLAPILEREEDVPKVVQACQNKGLILFFLLWALDELQ